MFAGPVTFTRIDSSSVELLFVTNQRCDARVVVSNPQQPTEPHSTYESYDATSHGFLLGGLGASTRYDVKITCLRNGAVLGEQTASVPT